MPRRRGTSKVALPPSRAKIVRARPYALSMRSGLLDFTITLLGFFALMYGVWQVYPPAAWILGGLLLLSYALQVARARAPLNTPDDQ